MVQMEIERNEVARTEKKTERERVRGKVARRRKSCHANYTKKL